MESKIQTLAKWQKQPFRNQKHIWARYLCFFNKVTATAAAANTNDVPPTSHYLKAPGFCYLQGLGSETPAVGAQEEGPHHTGSLEAPSAKRLKTQFRCSKCGFLTNDSAQFQQHIPQHKSDENTPQCLRCGLCFTSLLSLRRHLFIVHKVKDPEGDEGKKEKRGEVMVKEMNNQPMRSAETDEVNNWLPEQNKTEPPPPQAEESTNLHCDKTTDCNLKPSQTQSVSLC